MIQSATPLDRSAGEHPGEEKDALQATAPLPTQSWEDHRLAERVENALRATGYGALRPSGSPCAGVVILGGRVSSYYLKQIVQRNRPGCSGRPSDPQRPRRRPTKIETASRLETCDNHKARSSDPPDLKWSQD